MEFESTRMCELLVGLPDVSVLAVVDVAGQPLRVHVETREPRPSCPACGEPAVALAGAPVTTMSKVIPMARWPVTEHHPSRSVLTTPTSRVGGWTPT